jgi:hypothetical protein
MLTESAESGDRLATLRDLRDLLAAQVQGCDSLRDLAALSGRLQSVLAEIAELEPKKAEGDGIDEIARRRTARRSGTAAGAGRSKRSS